MPDWKKMKAEYVRDNVSYRKLAEKHGISPSTVYRKMRSENWADLRKQSERKVNAKIVDSIAEREAKRIEMFQTISDKLLRQISDGIDDGSLILSPRGYNDLTAALKNLRDVNGLKSELDMQEQQARIDKLRKEAAIEEQNNEVKVIISTDLEEYSK